MFFYRRKREPDKEIIFPKVQDVEPCLTLSRKAHFYHVYLSKPASSLRHAYETLLHHLEGPLCRNRLNAEIPDSHEYLLREFLLIRDETQIIVESYEIDHDSSEAPRVLSLHQITGLGKVIKFLQQSSVQQI